MPYSRIDGTLPQNVLADERAVCPSENSHEILQRFMISEAQPGIQYMGANPMLNQNERQNFGALRTDFISSHMHPLAQLNSGGCDIVQGYYGMQGDMMTALPSYEQQMNFMPEAAIDIPAQPLWHAAQTNLDFFPEMNTNSQILQVPSQNQAYQTMPPQTLFDEQPALSADRLSPVLDAGSLVQDEQVFQEYPGQSNIDLEQKSNENVHLQNALKNVFKKVRTFNSERKRNAYTKEIYDKIINIFKSSYGDIPVGISKDYFHQRMDAIERAIDSTRYQFINHRQKRDLARTIHYRLNNNNSRRKTTLQPNRSVSTTSVQKEFSDAGVAASKLVNPDFDQRFFEVPAGFATTSQNQVPSNVVVPGSSEAMPVSAEPGRVVHPKTEQVFRYGVKLLNSGSACTFAEAAKQATEYGYHIMRIRGPKGEKISVRSDELEKFYNEMQTATIKQIDQKKGRKKVLPRTDGLVVNSKKLVVRQNYNIDLHKEIYSIYRNKCKKEIQKNTLKLSASAKEALLRFGHTGLSNKDYKSFGICFHNNLHVNPDAVSRPIQNPSEQAKDALSFDASGA